MADTGYDPDEPESSKRRSSYLSRRDIKVLAILLVLFLAIMYPIYIYYFHVSQRYKCKTNLKDIGESINLYAEDWNDRYPVLYAIEPGTSDGPLLDKSNRPYTWGSLIDRYAKRRGILRCPSAEPEEALEAQDPQTTKRGVTMTYGMYVGLGSQPRNLIRSPDSTVLITETSNYGANDTYDPVPLRGKDGVPSPYDGFMIGYDTGLTPTRETQHVTRLAFEGTKDKDFSAKRAGRHFGKNLFLFAGGNVADLNANAAQVKMLGERPTGSWEVP